MRIPIAACRDRESKNSLSRFFNEKGLRLKKIIGLLLLLSSLALITACSRDGETRRQAPSGNGATASANRPPVVSGGSIYPSNPAAEKQLVAHYEAQDPDGDFIEYTFRWFVDGKVVQDGPAGSLNPSLFRKGSEIYVEILPADSFSQGKPFKTPSVMIGGTPPRILSINVEPLEPMVGAEITATPEAVDADGDDVIFLYQWFVNGKAVTETPQGNNRFASEGRRKKDMVHVAVIPSDRDSRGQAKDSDIIVLRNSAPNIESNPQYSLLSGKYTYQVVAKDTDGDRLTYTLVTAPQGMSINPSSGLVQWEVPKQVSGKEEVFIKVTVDDGDGGSAIQEFSIVLNP